MTLKMNKTEQNLRDAIKVVVAFAKEQKETHRSTRVFTRDGDSSYMTIRVATSLINRVVELEEHLA